jgi:hypothetical protein
VIELGVSNVADGDSKKEKVFVLDAVGGILLI